MYYVCVRTGNEEIADSKGNTYVGSIQSPSRFCLYEPQYHRMYGICGWLRVTPDRIELTDKGLTCRLPLCEFTIVGDIQRLRDKELLLPALESSDHSGRMELSADYPEDADIIAEGVDIHPCKPASTKYAVQLYRNYTKPANFQSVNVAAYYSIGLLSTHTILYIDRYGKLQKSFSASSNAMFYLLWIVEDKVKSIRPLRSQDFQLVSVEYTGDRHEDGLHEIYGLRPDVKTVYIPSEITPLTGIVGLLPDGGTIGTNIDPVDSEPVNSSGFIKACINDLQAQDENILYQQWCDVLKYCPPSLVDNDKPITTLMKFLVCKEVADV